MITCSADVTVYGTGNPVSQVSDISVSIFGDPNGSDINISQTNLDVPLFSLKDVFGSSFDDSDVLRMDPSALHAALYALELAKDDDSYVYGDASWDWDWVPSHVSLTCQGSCIAGIDGDLYGWSYKINGCDPGYKPISMCKLNDNDSVQLRFN